MNFIDFIGISKTLLMPDIIDVPRTARALLAVKKSEACEIIESKVMSDRIQDSLIKSQNGKR